MCRERFITVPGFVSAFDLQLPVYNSGHDGAATCMARKSEVVATIAAQCDARALRACEVRGTALPRADDFHNGMYGNNLFFGYLLILWFYCGYEFGDGFVGGGAAGADDSYDGAAYYYAVGDFCIVRRLFARGDAEANCYRYIGCFFYV